MDLFACATLIRNSRFFEVWHRDNVQHWSHSDRIHTFQGAAPALSKYFHSATYSTCSLQIGINKSQVRGNASQQDPAIWQNRKISFESNLMSVVWHILRKQRHALGSTSLTTPVSRCFSSLSSCCPWACSAARMDLTFALSCWSPLATVAMACVSICAHKSENYALYTQK